MPEREDIEAILEAHLGVGGLGRLPREPLRRFMALVGRGPDPEELREEALQLIEPLGLGSAEAHEEVAALLSYTQAAGMDLEHAVPVTQAYVRALSRIVEAEVAHLHSVLRDVPEERRMEVLDRILPAVVKASARGFEAVHRSLLHVALADELALDDVAGGDEPPLTIALVDLSGSTRYLEHASAAATEALVDGLFEAGQGAIVGRPVRVVKYVGDGFFLSGHEPLAVVEACLTAVAQIAAELPLPARAGVAAGPVTRRAGDLFGLPVNVAQLLTKFAPSGVVVSTEEVASVLPPAMRGETTTAVLRDGEPLRVVTLQGAPGDAGGDHAAPGDAGRDQPAPGASS